MMKARHRFVILLCVAIGIMAWRATRLSQRQLIEQNRDFTLYSLNGYPEGQLTKGEKFHRHRILGRTLVTDPNQRRKLIATLYDGIEEYRKLGNGPASCFLPRHGIRAVTNGKAIDIVICFECSRAVFYENGRSHEEIVSNAPQKLYDEVLSQAKVPLGERRH